MFSSFSTPLNSVNPPKKENSPITSTPLSQVHTSSGPDSFTNQPPTTVSSTARPYKTREKLYYETEYVKHEPTVSTTSNTSASRSSALFEPFLKKQTVGAEEIHVDELPPIASLHEYSTASPSTGGILNTASSNIKNTTYNNNINNGSVNINNMPFSMNGILGSPMKSTVNSGTSANIASSLAFDPWSTSAFDNSQLETSPQLSRSVTIFGFPPNLKLEILTSFQSYGAIENYDLSTDGNWLHITFETEWGAQKALTRNGSIFNSTGVMIGVVPMQNALEQVNTASNSFMSPIKRNRNLDADMGREQERESEVVGFRNATQSQSQKQPSSIFLSKNKSSTTGNSENLNLSLSNLPNESSIVTRAVNYIFGW